ncbi:Cro/Cl family transcriptional regulator [Aeromonas sp. FDAARGOS 1407]|uniref:Cro/CI family transcriptional regulator n=1 Tax=Aeromonas sp. FDAARGOS 1407 TaxID=2778056 RepID=UPI001C23E1FB|nr:Cro/Cl family transcriptional regulator [Aeromonas sp. FDAARGOS 1407]
MKTDDVIAHFGGITPLAKALGVKTQAISQWGENIPKLRAYQIEVVTGGALKADPATPSGQQYLFTRTGLTASVLPGWDNLSSRCTP